MSQLWKYQWPIWLSWRKDASRQLHADFETCEQQAWAQCPLTGFGISFLVSVSAEDCSGPVDVGAWRFWRVLVIEWKRFGKRRGSAFRWREQTRETGLSPCFYSKMSSWKLMFEGLLWESSLVMKFINAVFMKFWYTTLEVHLLKVRRARLFFKLWISTIIKLIFFQCIFLHVKKIHNYDK